LNRQSLKRAVLKQEKPKCSKHANKKTTIDGHTFDSRAEARYYMKLKRMLTAGLIKEFEMQKPFVVHDGFSKNGKKYSPITYKADFFVTYADGEQVVIDVKGQPKVTADFAMKFKMFHARYPYRFIIARYNYTTKQFVEKETLR